MRLTGLIFLIVGSTTAWSADWRLVWSDEFDKAGAPDVAKWGFEEGYIRNRELQLYRPENARVANGVLVIEARKEADGKITSASVTTEGKASWRHGRVEVRAKLPTGRGTWPAIWMLGTNHRKTGWPACGEIDIMENVGFDPEIIHANVHTKKYNHSIGTGKGDKITLAKPWADFHTYSVEWDANAMEFFVDGKRYFRYENERSGFDAWPYDEPFYLILNVAIGGAWGGRNGVDDSLFPARMEVDYVRVYESAPSAGDVVLPKAAPTGGKPLLEALAKRQTSREFAATSLPDEVLSRLLWAAYGINRPNSGGRTAPSAHGWQVIDVYVALAKGLYRFDAKTHRLLLVSPSDAREIAGTQDFVAGAPLNLVYVARMEKMAATAEDSEDDLLAWAAVEAGAVSQNVALFCASEGLGSVVRAGVQRDRFAREARLGAESRILLAQTVGYPR